MEDAIAHHRFATARLKEGHLFLNKRSRLQRVRDSRHFTAWVDHLLPHEARFRLKSLDTHLAIDDLMAVELAGRDHGAIFIGKVKGILGSKVDVEILRGLTPVPKREHARICFEGQSSVIAYEGSQHIARMVDFSEAGIGVRLSTELETGSDLEFELRHAAEMSPWQGKVLYCREDLITPGQFRAGIQVVGLDRLEHSRWKNIMNESFVQHQLRREAA